MRATVRLWTQQSYPPSRLDSLLPCSGVIRGRTLEAQRKGRQGRAELGTHPH